MTRRTWPVVPVNIIGGSLGVGKTTTVNHLLRHRPPRERWAVLINEYGLVGLDAALIEDGGQGDGRASVEVREAAGGCICCSANVIFEHTLVQVLRTRPDRLLIEPSGLATLSGVLDTLARKGIREAVDVRSVVVVMDPTRLEDALSREDVRNQVDCADILIANNADRATAQQLAGFDTWARGLFPSKQFVGHVDHGRVAVDLLDAVSARTGGVAPGGHEHGPKHEHDHRHHDADGHHVHVPGDNAEREHQAVVATQHQPIQRRAHSAAGISTVGWVCWPGLVFEADRATVLLRRFAELRGARRVKAVMRTTRGWLAFNLVDGIEEASISGHRRDSRIEVIIETPELVDLSALDEWLRAAVERGEAA